MTPQESDRTIIIRADGNSEIGLGHLIRCSALAHMLKHQYGISFCCREIPDKLVKEFKKDSFQCIIIKDEKEFLDRLSSKNIAVIDGYNFSINYQKQIKATGAKLVCIDDLHEREFVADLVINHAPGIEPHDYDARPYSQFALGLDYSLLRPAFLKQAKRTRQIENIETVLICFGGSDPCGLTIQTIRVVTKFDSFRKIIVITGSAFNETLELDQLLRSDNRIDHRRKLNEMQMLDSMLEAGLAIVPASGILYEALSAGCKVISGYSADNQRFVYENLRDSGFFVDVSDFAETALNKALSEVPQQKREKSKAIDGKSPSRIAKLFDQLFKETLVKMREAQKDDLETTFTWASNSDIRRYSFQQHQITHNEHSQWFNKRVNDNKCLYLIAELNGIPIGSVRFDLQDREAVISYLVDPGYHGQGFGVILLKKGIECLLNSRRTDVKQIRMLTGEVMKNNIPSLKAFERFGFIKVDQETNYKFTKWLTKNHLQ